MRRCVARAGGARGRDQRPAAHHQRPVARARVAPRCCVTRAAGLLERSSRLQNKVSALRRQAQVTVEPSLHCRALGHRNSAAVCARGRGGCWGPGTWRYGRACCISARSCYQLVERLTKAANLLQVTLINIMVHVAFQHSALLTRVFSAPCT